MKKIGFVAIIIIFFNISHVYAYTNDIIEKQKENFKISQFIEETKKYSSDFFQQEEISEMLNIAISGKIENNKLGKKVFNLFGKELENDLKLLLKLLIIILIHSILKSICDNLDNSSGVSQIAYYIQYILIVTIIMSNFTEIIENIRETTTNLVGFMNTLIPLLITLMIYTGNIITSSVVEPIILLLINFLGNFIEIILIPIVLIITVLSIISKISDKVQIEKISKFLKSGVIWFLGIILTLFVSVISLEGTLSSSVDGVTAKTAKAAVSTAIPVVGKILGDAVDTVLGCGLILKNAIGIFGVLIIVGICIIPIIKLRNTYRII